MEAVTTRGSRHLVIVSSAGGLVVVGDLFFEGLSGLRLALGVARGHEAPECLVEELLCAGGVAGPLVEEAEG